ncbi:MAG TPA: hypothetical protein VK696_08220 [Steroidobacteraceae bacterium]|jgi:hypothetical protein|nr:hypothetical protein [Steroidobacteraceae bacterium]
MAARVSALLALSVIVSMAPAHSQTPGAAPAPSSAPGEHGPQRPPLFFREEWKQGPKGGENPVTAASLGNPDLELTLIVPGGTIELTGNAGDENNPTHVWQGLCTTPCGLALRSKQHLADLTGLARLRWNTKMSGFHQVRPIVKLADGTWLAADRTEGSPRDWMVSELSFADLHWLKLDITRAVTTGVIVDHVDLSKVDQIGFIDLMPGSGHGPGGWSDVAQIEVYARSVAR